MDDRHVEFNDAAGYEAFMGRWSRLAGTPFLEWLGPAKNKRWLDIGCGTGAFTQLIVSKTSPRAVSAVDPSPAQIEGARSTVSESVDFRVADGQTLPFVDDSFDYVVSALVLNFIPGRVKAVTEMRRVAVPGGMVAAYVWDFAGERSPGSFLRLGMRASGFDAPETPGAADSTLERLQAIFTDCGLDHVETNAFDVNCSFLSFDELWRQISNFPPLAQRMLRLSAVERERVQDTLRATIPATVNGRLTYSARAHAVRGRVPG